jgi:antitoxin ParD1/3/4
MNIALSAKLKEFVQGEVRRRGYSSVSEYVRELIRGDQERQERARLEAEIIKGIESGPATPMRPEHWLQLKAEARKRIHQKPVHSATRRAHQR